MEEFKGTKGEWIVNENAIICNKITIAVTLLQNFALNADGTMSKDKKMEANAKLIAAAPDLLNALKECMIELYSIYSQYGDKENALEHSHALTISKQAINKALK